MKRISIVAIAILLIGAASPAAATTVPVCPPQWLVTLLPGAAILFACSIDEDGGSAEEENVRLPYRNAKERSDTVFIRNLNRLAPDDAGARADAYREYSSGERGKAAVRPPRRTWETIVAP